MRGLTCLLMASAMMLTACGPSGGPWSAPPKSGLWQMRYTEGPQNGTNMVICFAPVNGYTMTIDETAGKLGNGADCQTPTHKVVASGWESDQTCNLNGAKATVRETFTGDASSDVTVVAQAYGPDGSTVSPEESYRKRLVGDCPSGWRVGDWLEINKDLSDGQWRLVHPGQRGVQTLDILQTLPPEVAALAQ